jgi:hypothetical protein
VVEENTGFQYQSLPMLYLGVPLYKGHKKAVLFEDLINKMKRRLLGWENRWLSACGRLTLIKHVLGSMPMHLLQILDPPKCIINNISRMINGFIWGETSQNKKIHWSSWDNICYPVEEGGIGCNSLVDLTIAYNCKLWWKFREQKSLWSQVMKAKYCRVNHACIVDHSYQESNLWKRMIKVRNLVEPQIAWRIGEGKANFKHDVWLKSGAIQGRLKQEIHQDKCVMDFRKNNEWDTTMLNDILPGVVVNEISKIPISNQPDKMFWKPNASGKFTISSCINLFRQCKTRQLAYKHIWNKIIPQKIAFLGWRLWNDWLPVEEIIQKKYGIRLASKCQCCCNSESINHVFLEGPIAKEVW